MLAGSASQPLLAGNGVPQIVNQLERDLSALENIASRISNLEQSSGTPGSKSAKQGTKDAPPKMQSPSKGGVEDFGKLTSPIRSGHCRGYNFVFCVPLPSVCTDEQSADFEKRFLQKSGETFEEAIRHTITSPSLRKTAVFDGKCTHLKEARHCVIQLILSFFESLGASLHSGLEVFEFTSEDCEELFICVRMTDHLSEALADMGDYAVQLSPDCMSKLHIKISETEDLVPAFVNYETHMQEEGLLRLYPKDHKPDEINILRSVDTMRLLYDKITDYIDLHELGRMGLITTWYLAHNKDKLDFFNKTWANFGLLCSKSQPIDEIRDYFGEGVAFYFLFLGFLQKGLLALLPLSCICSAGWYLGYPDQSQCLFCLFIIIWSTAFLKLWRRTESHYANKWGTDRKDVKSRVKVPVNPNFHGEKMPSPNDENVMELQASPMKAKIGNSISAAVTIIVVSAVIVCVLLNQFLIPGTMGAVILSVQIQFWDKTWEFVVVDRMIELEQHVTQYAYDQARVAKTFAFKLINTFYAFFYIAYVQVPMGDVETCGGDCKFYLFEQLGIVFATYITFGLVDMGLPYTILKIKIWREAREARKHNHEVFKLSLLEQQSKMVEYTGQCEDADYLQSLFPVAFVMLFGNVMPISVFLAMVALSSQIRTHAWKLTKVSRRPFPVSTSGIGIWDPIMTFLTYASVFNTIGLLVTQIDNPCEYIPGFWRLSDALGVERSGKAAKLVLFFCLQNTAMIGKMISDYLVSDVMPSTEREKMRQEVQRVRLGERDNVEMHETIAMRCSTDMEKIAYDKIHPLQPGNPMYVEPMV